MTDKQKICKCGTNVADLMHNIRTLNDNVTKVKIEEMPTYMVGFKLSIYSIHSDTGKIEESCGIDTVDQQRTSL